MTQLRTSSLDDRLTALFASEPGALAQGSTLMRELREERPIYEHASAVLFSRHADARVLLRDEVNFGKAERYMNDTVRDSLSRMTPDEQRVYAELSAFEGLQLTAVDGAEHARIRGIMHRAMTQQRIGGLEASVRDATNTLLEPLRDLELADLMEFAYRLPLIVICDLLGIPAADREQIHLWTSAIGRNKGGIPFPSTVVDAHAAMAEFRAYIEDMLEDHRRTNDKSDLLAALMNAEGERLTTDELAANFAMLLLAGHETTTNLIGIGLLELLRQPAQWRALCADRQQASAAVEELLRYVSPVQWVMRIPVRDFEYGSLTIPKGRLVFVMLAAANRDPEAFADPERLLIKRTDSANLLTFGLGAHFCLGNSLARMEGRIAFETIARRWPDMQLATDDIRWDGNARLRTLTELPVALGPRDSGD